MKKKKLLSGLLLIVSVCLCACWDQKPVEELAIIGGLGFDIYPENPNLLDITFAYPIFTEDKRAGEKLDTIAAANLGEAISILEQRSAWRFAGGKVRVILISEEAAQLGLPGFLDYLQLPLVDDNAYTVVVVGQAASILQAKLPETERIAVHIQSLLRASATEGHTLRSTVADLSTRINSPGLDPILPRLSLKGEERVSLDGAALFKDMNMVGHISLEEMRLFMALHGKSSAVTLVPNVGVNERLEKPVVEIELISPKTRIKPKLVGGKLQVGIEVKAAYILRTISTNVDITKPEEIKALTQDIEANLTIELLRLLAKFQELRVDPLGIGNRFRAGNSKQFDPDAFREQWAEASLDLKVKLQLFRSGALNKTIAPNKIAK